MLDRALSQGIKPDWVLGNSVYGSWEFRDFLEQHHQPYVLGVTSQQRLWLNFEQVRIDQIVKDKTDKEWVRQSAGTGSKGERIYAGSPGE